MPTAATVLSDYAKLSTAEQNIVKARITSIVSSVAASMEKYIEEIRFADDRVCPHCGCVQVVRNGKRKDGTQRYLCRDCGKSFVITANTIVHGTKKTLSVWEKFIECVMNEYSVRKCAAICKIHRNTAFAWRHKVLDALQHMADSVVLEGIIEADETFFDVPNKGNHSKGTFTMPRKGRKQKRSVHCQGMHLTPENHVNSDALKHNTVYTRRGIRNEKYDN